MTKVFNTTIDKRRRTVLLGGLVGSAAGLLQACGGGGGAGETSVQSQLGAFDPSCKSMARPTTPSPIPGNQVNLSDFGGTPGASASAIKSAFSQAFNRLKSLGGGTLYIAPGTYDLGYQPAEVVVMGVSDLKNVLISAYDAQLTMTTTASTGMPVFLHFENPNNVTVAGMRFYDYGTNLNINWKGAVCISVNTTVACSGFKTVDCYAESVGTFWRSMPNNHYTLTNCDINGTIKTAYYGINCNYNGRYSKCNISCENVRRAFIAYGTQNWDIVINGRADGRALGSNAYVSLAPTEAQPVRDVTVILKLEGNLSQYGGFVHVYHQGSNGVSQYARNVKAHAVLNNVTGTAGAIFLFDHEPPGGVVLTSTIRTFEQIMLTGEVIGSYSGPLIRNPSRSTGSTNSISVANNLADLQNRSSLPMSSLPEYFSVSANLQPPAAPAPEPTPQPAPAPGGTGVGTPAPTASC